MIGAGAVSARASLRRGDRPRRVLPSGCLAVGEETGHQHCDQSRPTSVLESLSVESIGTGAVMPDANVILD